jgi:hypothetical protein
VALLSAGIVLVNIAFYASWYLWWAGHGWGPRFLVMILPFATLPLAAALEAGTRHRALAIALALLAVLSIAVQVLGVAINFNHYLEDAYAELGLYHPATLFEAAHSPLVRQWSYLRLEYLDLAWARSGTVDWVALLVGLGLLLASALGLWAVWHRRFGGWVSAGLPPLLALGAGLLLCRYTPEGDVAAAAWDLTAMEFHGEAAALTEPLLTEPFQDAYDGNLWVWGVPSLDEVEAGQDATWSFGSGHSRLGAARFQVGRVRLDYYARPGEAFNITRLPVLVLEEAHNLGNVVELVALRLDRTMVHTGEMLPLTLYWRALAPVDASYTVFVQALDEAGVKAGQIDRLPCNGDCPTTTWQSDELTGEQYDLPIRIGAPPGRYRLIAGMYDLATDQRLPVLDAQGSVASDHVLLDTVEVLP